MAEVNDNGSIQLFEDQKIRTAYKAECGRHSADSTGKGADAGTVNLYKILFGFLNPKRLDRVAFPPEIM